MGSVPSPRRPRAPGLPALRMRRRLARLRLRDRDAEDAGPSASERWGFSRTERREALHSELRLTAHEGSSVICVYVCACEPSLHT